MNREAYILINGIVVTEHELLKNHAVIIEAGKIKSVTPQKDIYYENSTSVIDCKGKYILPGFIDIHSDMIESIIVPRKGIAFDYRLALQEADRQLISQGITTMYHSISIANSTICNRPRTLAVDEMLNIGDIIHSYSPDLLIHHRFHARLELNTIEAFDGIKKRLKQGKIHELSLMNHAPGQGQYANLENFRREVRKQYGGISSEDIERVLIKCQEKPLLSQAQIDTLVNLAKIQRIPTALHDVGTEKQLDFMIRNGIKICEFPLSAEIASAATEKGLHSIVGAPNILRNKSQNNNASAVELLKNDLAQIICSDYFTPTMLLSVFVLYQRDSIMLPKAVSYATINPARAVCIDNEYGSIAPGKRGDVIVVEMENELPRVTMAFVDGKKKLELWYER